ncbi:unnamed protein product [Protopolystoma xenopodis]|uniref:Uncharacterized protein n=1 Tax=Protopolystoma xenopodis TaxID=117903 RepID=A0A3S5B875_9PLAT|nr:unnamed protein product [Protopolystoma xenopodis]
MMVVMTIDLSGLISSGQKSNFAKPAISSHSQSRADVRSSEFIVAKALRDLVRCITERSVAFRDYDMELALKNVPTFELTVIGWSASPFATFTTT